MTPSSSGQSGAIPVDYVRFCAPILLLWFPNGAESTDPKREKGNETLSEMGNSATAARRPKKARLMQGNLAIAEGALAAGLGFFASYPITPANEIANFLSRALPKRGAIFIQMEDEIASLAAVIGASVGGLKAATATSGPGFSLMQENIGYAAAAEIPCVIIDVQRAGPSTGRPGSPAQGDVMQARWGTHGDHPIIVLCPGSVREAYELTIHAFNLSEQYRTPVILLTDEVLARMWESVELPLAQVEVLGRLHPEVPPEWYFPYDDALGDVPPLVPFGQGYRYHVTGLFHDRSGFPTERLDEIDIWQQRLFGKIEGKVEQIARIEEEEMEDAEIAIIAYGSTARSARHAMKLAREENRAVGLLRLVTLWPFHDKAIERVASSVKRIIVAEMNRGQILLEVERVAKGRANVVGVNRADGAMVTPAQIMAALEVER